MKLLGNTGLSDKKFLLRYRILYDYVVNNLLTDLLSDGNKRGLLTLFCLDYFLKLFIVKDVLP